MIGQLSREVSRDIPVAAAPRGIINFPQENGIELEVQDVFRSADGNILPGRDGTPINEVDSENRPVMRLRTASEIGEIATEMATAIIGDESSELGDGSALGTDVNLETSPDPEYSQIRIEQLLGDVSDGVKRMPVEATDPASGRSTVLPLGQHRLAELRADESDPIRQLAAERTIDAEIMPGSDQATYHEAQVIVQRGEAGGYNKRQINKARSDINLIERRNSGSAWFKGVREADRKKRRAKGRKGMVERGMTVEQIEDTMGSAGRHQEKIRKQITRKRGRFFDSTRRVLDQEASGRDLYAGEDRATRKRRRAEHLEDRNLIAKKGTVLNIDDRRWVVADVLEAPAMAFVEIENDPTDPAGKRKVPIIDPSTGEPALTPMYRAKKDGKGNTEYETIIISGSPVTVAKIEEAPVLRGDFYSRGSNRVNGRVGVPQEQFYDQYGMPINDENWSRDSFDSMDDRVILKPLLSGEEAIRVIINGENPELLDDLEIRIKHLVAEVQQNPELIEDLETRQEILENSLVFEASIEAGEPGDPTPNELRAPFDRSERTGHFRRFNYTDPITERRRKEEAEIRRLGRARYEFIRKYPRILIERKYDA